MSRSMKVLIDRNLEIFAITHKTVLAPQSVKWGDRDHIIEVAQRISSPPRSDEGFRRDQLPWLATVCNLAKQRRLEFFTSFEIRMEKMRQKGRDEGYLGINLFRDVPIKSIRSPVQRSILLTGIGSIGIAKKKQEEFFGSIQDQRFLQIRRAIGDGHIDDAYHLWTAEKAGLDVFLTMDQRFWRVIRQKNKIIKSSVRVLTPKELGEHLDAEPSDLEKLAAEINQFR